MTLCRVSALIKKEFLAVLLDKKSRAQIFAAPFLMLFIFSFAVTMDVSNVSMAVLNLDEGEAGRRFVSFFSGSPVFTNVFGLSGAGGMERAIEAQEAAAALSIPADFSRKLAAGEPVSVQLILDGRKTNAANILNGYVSAITAKFNAETRARSAVPHVSVTARHIFNPNLDYIWFTLPVLLVILTQMLSLMVSGMSIARERELGTFEQLLISPLSPTEIIIGKAVPAVCIAFGEGAVIHLAAISVFGVPFSGSLPLLALSMLIFIMSVTGVGLFISSLSGTQQQAFLGVFMYMVPAVLLSGFAAPVENMPDGLQGLTLLNPMRHIISISLGLYLKDAPFEDILPELCWLSGMAAVTLVFAALFFKRKTQ